MNERQQKEGQTRVSDLDEAAPAKRGRAATTPAEIPLAGWRDISLRAWHAMSNDHVGIVAAGVGFYMMLAVVPGIAAFISTWGLVLEPSEVEASVKDVVSMLPPAAAELVIGEIRDIAGKADGTMSAAVAVSLLLALFTASRGMLALIDGLNIVYAEREQRSFLLVNLTAYGMTMVLLVVLVSAFAVIGAFPGALEGIGLDALGQTLVTWLRWPVLAMIAMAGLAAIYRYAPSRANARWKWVSIGASLATVLWLAGSVGFSFYVSQFGSYDESYGSLGAVVVLMLWFWLSAYIVLVGAEFNAEMEHQTARDTTAGDRKPMGKRGAYVADHVAESP